MVVKTTAIRYHDICCGHRVVGHEGKCKNLHGHNYRFHFHIASDKLDEVGRVLDFSMIKEKLCEWLEQKWDHKMLIWKEDPNVLQLMDIDKSVVVVPFNPTAENIAEYFITSIAPVLLLDTGCHLEQMEIEETRKCSVSVKIEN